MFRSKLPDIGTTIFSVMTALAQEVGAVNCSQGFPDFPIDPQLADLLGEASRKGANQYAPMPGLMLLREAVSEKYSRAFGLSVDPDTTITITSGGTVAIATAICASVRPGDNVIVFEPAYDSYIPTIELNGGTARISTLVAPDYRPDWEHVRSLIDEKTSMIIINTPHNPCGTVFTDTDIAELAEITRDTDIVVLSDEVYELITHDDAVHCSVLANEELAARSFVVTSFGKTFHITGWKIGACVAPPNLTREFRKAHQYVSFCVNAPAQSALATYMQDSSTYLGVRSFMERKRYLFLEQIVGSRWTLRPCKGSYFQLLGYERFSNEVDIDLAMRLTREAGVASIPLSPFMKSGKQPDTVLRFCFAKSDETLQRAGERLRSI